MATMVQLSNNMAAADVDSTWLGVLILQVAKMKTKNDTGPAL